jgi:hypothetical protein
MNRSKAVKPFQCRQCGNGRDLFPAACPFCHDDEPPEALAAYAKLDLDRLGLTVEDAVRRFEEALRIATDSGLKWLVVLHGYGSTGNGGRIRQALRQGLQDNFWADRVWEAVVCDTVRSQSDLEAALGGEQRDLHRCMERERLLGNPGATVLVLNRPTGG